MAKRIYLKEGGLDGSGPVPAGYKQIGYEGATFSEKSGFTSSTIGGGSGGSGIIEVTYADLLSLSTGSTLVPGNFYLITDFATKHYIPNSGSVVNTGVTEPLLVQAIAVNKIDFKAVSMSYPKDIIYYELVDSATIGDKGRIYYREDTQLNIAFYDWRNVKFRRWASSQVLVKSGGISFLGTNGSYVTGSISGATGFVLSTSGSNTGRVFNLTGVFQVGDVLTVGGSGAGTVSSATDYRFEAITNNGRASVDYYTFNNSAIANLCANNYIGKKTEIIPSSDGLNNIVFFNSAVGNKLTGYCIDCSLQSALNNDIDGSFYNNIVTASMNGNNISGSFINNTMHSVGGNTNINASISNNKIYVNYTGNSITSNGTFSGNTFRSFTNNMINIGWAQFTNNVSNTGEITYCDIRTAVAGNDFTLSTIVYNGYPKILVNDYNIIYWDNLGVQQVSSVTA